MNLNHIQLPASVVADLYKRSLVLSEQEFGDHTVSPLKKTGDSANKWKYLGENKKNILAVVNYSDSVHLPDEELSLLTKLFTACKLSLADVAIVNGNNYDEINYKEMIAQFSSKIIFLFGIDPVSFGLPVNFPHFQLQPFAGATFLFAPPLEDLGKDELLKSKLWVCLRRLFAI
ncbi:MAG TPA: hypothetical protein VFI06_07480 [Chitinophagaceae bacterium]|nr:hypothetical protein [Chitinophagaceae bacterium]